MNCCAHSWKRVPFDAAESGGIGTGRNMLRATCMVLAESPAIEAMNRRFVVPTFVPLRAAFALAITSCACSWRCASAATSRRARLSNATLCEFAFADFALASMICFACSSACLRIPEVGITPRASAASCARSPPDAGSMTSAVIASAARVLRCKSDGHCGRCSFSLSAICCAADVNAALTTRRDNCSAPSPMKTPVGTLYPSGMIVDGSSRRLFTASASWTTGTPSSVVSGS